MDICLQVLKESNKSRFDSYSVRNSVLNISHITFRDCRVHSFFDNLSRNSCISGTLKGQVHGSAHAHLSKCCFVVGTRCIVYASNMIMS